MTSTLSRQSDFLRRHPMGLAAVLFALFIPFHIVLPVDQSIILAGVTLALIGGAYIGFAARADSANVFWMELAVAMLFGLTAVLGITVHWAFLPAGLAFHAVWDLLHHNREFGAAVPNWFLPMRTVFNGLTVQFLLLLYGAELFGA
ncbi:DUF6010 family protein [Gymnodinialimonas ceratoperidinii]|uniref:Uncharacterized protein n=1 Tax=Gymnodinialimonas ceratoperidinii TaxID=2856823 RepID=A0A8F6YBI5_9RHOB|nr:DUF6010 family protein [Gymnodinialimonas ceratoperidinii]QXT41004.1 hypothetical protein KYE46_07235 [Gymnodinialimonas ceratoperidinii]